MSQLLFSNNAGSTLAGGISNVATTANLAPGTGVLFPAPTGGQYFVGTFTNAATGLLNEIVHVTNVTGDVITMVRAQEGTTALNWLANDLFDNNWTAGQAATILTTAQGVHGNQQFVGSGTFTVPANVYTVRFQRWGGGGGGAGGNVIQSGSGGGSGEYADDWLPVTPGQTVAIVIGAGGTAGAINGGAGGNGGNTTVAGLPLTHGGSGSTALTLPGLGGTGNTTSTVHLDGGGGNGSMAGTPNGEVGFGGSANGGGGQGGTGGANAVAPGGGGAGGNTNAPSGGQGGPGAAGGCIVTW